MKSKHIRILSFLLIFSFFCGFCLNPQTYKAGDEVFDIGYSGSNYFYYRTASQTYSAYQFSESGATAAIATAYTHFRVWIHLPQYMEEGDSLIISSLKLKYFGGTISNVSVWLGTRQEAAPYATAAMCSNEIVLTKMSNDCWGSGTRLTCTGETQWLCVDYDFTNRSSTTVFQPIGDSLFIIDGHDYNKVIYETQLEIWDTSKSIFENLANLPAFFAQEFDTILSNVGTWITNLPANIKVALTALFKTVETAVTNLPANIKGFFDNISDGLFNMSEEQEESLDPFDNGIHSIDSWNKLSEMGDWLTNDDSLISEDAGLFLGKTMSLIFSIPNLTSKMVMVFLTSVVGYVFFGKR